MIEFKRPPIGIKPQITHDLIRLDELQAAMLRFIEVDRPVPHKWTCEYLELYTRYGEETVANLDIRK